MPDHVEHYVRGLLLVVVVLLLPAAELGREGAAMAGGGRGGRPVHRSLDPVVRRKEGRPRPNTDPCC